MLGILLPNNEEIVALMPDPMDVLENTIGKRFVKTHLPWELLPLQIRDGSKKPKVAFLFQLCGILCFISFLGKG